MTDGPSFSELGINLEIESPKITLPSPDRKFYREEGLDNQEVFSNKVKDIVLVPVCNELSNGNLENFLKQLNNQSGFDQDKLGVLLFINDTKDKDEKTEGSNENRLTSEFLSCLSSKDVEGLNNIDLSDEYKELGKAIIAKDQLEIKMDYLQLEPTVMVPFGFLRTHLFQLANTFRNTTLPPQEIILHLSDIDVDYSPSHFSKLHRFYAEPSHAANISEEDFIPGVHEGSKEEDISRDLLLTFDKYRLFSALTDTYEVVNGGVRSGTPTISGRLSYFLPNGKLDSSFEDALFWDSNEDYTLGEEMIKNSKEIGQNIGNVEEVYRLHRARTPQHSGHSINDAENAYSATKNFIEGKGPTGEDEPLNTDKLLKAWEQQIDKNHGTTNSISAAEDYNPIVLKEIRREAIKVRLRRARLFSYIGSLADGSQIGEAEQKIISPYEQYFEDETENMKKMLAEGKTSEQVGIMYLQKYDSFFNPQHPIHTEIARVRAFKRYIFAHNLTNH